MAVAAGSVVGLVVTEPRVLSRVTHFVVGSLVFVKRMKEAADRAAPAAVASLRAAPLVDLRRAARGLCLVALLLYLTRALLFFHGGSHRLVMRRPRELVLTFAALRGRSLCLSPRHP